MIVTNWSLYHPYFTRGELACRHTGECKVTTELMDALLKVRQLYGKPMVITSGYRHPSHPVEASKVKPGEHAMGLAVDVACQGDGAHDIIKLALSCGFNRIGVSQRAGKARFVHLGIGGPGLPSPRIWSY